MKCTKRFAALVLAMMMAFSVMAVTAAAYDSADAHAHEGCCENEIEPRIKTVRCTKCGGSAYEHTEYLNNKWTTWLECEDCGWKDYK